MQKNVNINNKMLSLVFYKVMKAAITRIMNVSAMLAAFITK
jgi:hypothetical protein